MKIILILTLFITLELIGAGYYIKNHYAHNERRDTMSTKFNRVIVFDGASSSGKTSVIKQLLPMLDDSYHYISIDDFVSQVFLEQQTLHLPEKEFLARVTQQCDVMYEKIKKLIAEGKNVILDTVLSGLEGEKSINYNFKKLQNIPVFLILTHCPLPTLIARIKNRNMLAKQEHKHQDERSVILAISQFMHIYKSKTSSSETLSETLLEKLSQKDIESACKETKKEFGINLDIFNKFKENVSLQLGVNNQQEVSLTPRLTYDYIIDTSKHTPHECVRLIKEKIMPQNSLIKKRLPHEPPIVIAQHGWRYHHIGIPYNEPRPGETHHKHLKIYVAGFETSPYGIEWMRFEKDCPVPDIVRTVPHVAFEVDNLDEALKGKDLLLEPGEPSGGVRAAMILHDGAPIELIEFRQQHLKNVKD
jgi:chloramphenicol 3-O-phosphotransferase